jgi:hypothetical protein
MLQLFARSSLIAHRSSLMASLMFSSLVARDLCMAPSEATDAPIPRIPAHRSSFLAHRFLNNPSQNKLPPRFMGGIKGGYE